MEGRKLKKDILLNMISSFILVLSILWIVRIAGNIFEPVTLGIFLFSRRLAETLANALQLGTSFTLRRYLPMTDKRSVKGAYILCGLGVLALVALIFCTGLLIDLNFWAKMVFGNGYSRPESLMFWTAMLALTIALNYQAVSILIAYRFVIGFSLVNLFNISVWLLIGLWWWGNQNNVQTILSFQAVMGGILSTGVILWMLAGPISINLNKVSMLEIRQALKEFITYGSPRTISTFIETLFYLIGPWLIRDKIEVTGYLLISFTLLRVGRVIIRPVSTILGVVSARLAGKGDEDSLRYGVNILFGALLYTGIILSIFMYAWIQPLLEIWLKKPQLVQEVYKYAVIMTLVILPVTIFQGLKEIIEMIWKKPLNLYTLTFTSICLVSFFLISKYFLSESQSVLYGYFFSLWFSGFITIWWIRSYLKPLTYFGLNRLLFIVTIVGLLNIGLSRYFPLTSLTTSMTTAVISVTLSIGILLLGLLFYKPAAFVYDLSNFLWPRFAKSILR